MWMLLEAREGWRSWFVSSPKETAEPLAQRAAAAKT
jgi:hypothetical protein